MASTPQPYPQRSRSAEPPPPRPRQRNWAGLVLSGINNVSLGVLVLGVTVVSGTLIGLAVSFRNLPEVQSLRYYVPNETTTIVDINGTLIASLHGEANRQLVPLEAISNEMKLSLLAIEDSHFYLHSGINPVRIGRAFLGSVQGGLGSAGGGSTLTMQLVKNLFLTPDRTISRKAAEAVLAVRVEQVFDKNEILEMYLNQVYWGHNLYGIETAAESYFDKEASELNLAESAMLAGLLQAPEQLSPFRNFEAAKRRQETVLQRMVELEWIDADTALAAAQQELTLGQITSFQASAPAIADAIEAELIDRFGRDALLRGGFRVQATIDLDLQREAQQAVNDGAAFLQQYNRQANQLALVAVDPRTGFIKAMVGGVNAERGQFNRSIQAIRQPGSAFKPFVYYTALASGRYSLTSLLNDSPITYPDGPGRTYSPRNYDSRFMGTLTLQRALELSRNVPAVKLANAVGVSDVIESARAAGIQQAMQPNLSLALGAADITPLEMASAYATFANGGVRIEPSLILQVIDTQGNIIETAQPDTERTLDPWAVASLVEILQGVTLRGTGVAARLEDGRPLAGKTGTTSDFRDAWFVGFTPQLSTAVWIGNDNNSPMAHGTTGGGYVAPIWKQFMDAALADVPVEEFPPAYQFTRPASRNQTSPELR
ncbi:transglycosylase domain-containing protein [Synechococcus sp. PCC 7336]|uniref:transglycosylase domain-containing protein n=1 Tax=Synechococcus sp. PCC 7336 TaxID=195250 RepID=UPI00034A0697|nr:PBP1A family penicillin-binding protein [Synechococcus sp. PCC 7336]